MITITLTLATGETYRKSYLSMPRYWRSEALRLAPYGSNLHGAVTERSR